MHTFQGEAPGPVVSKMILAWFDLALLLKRPHELSFMSCFPWKVQAGGGG